MAKLCWAEWAQIFTVYASMVYGFLAVCNMVFDEDEVQMSGIAFLMSLVLLFLESPPQALNKYFASYNNCFARMIVIIGCKMISNPYLGPDTKIDCFMNPFHDQSNKLNHLLLQNLTHSLSILHYLNTSSIYSSSHHTHAELDLNTALHRCAIPGFFHAAPAAGSICLIVGAIMYGWGGFSGEAAGPKNASHSL